MSTVVKDLGAVSAYAYAVEKGYTGTEAEFAELMASYAEVGQTAVNAAESALNSKTAAQTAATTATNKASEATTAAQTSTTKAGEASQSASEANAAKEKAITAQTAAETAQGKAEDAQAAAESVAESIPSDYSQLSEDVSDLKEDLSAMSTATSSDVGKALKAKTVADGKVTEWEFGETDVSVDPTLTIEGKAADAKATGEAVNDVNAKVDALTSLKFWNSNAITLFQKILNSAVYDADASADITALIAELNKKPVTKTETLVPIVSTSVDSTTFAYEKGTWQSTFVFEAGEIRGGVLRFTYDPNIAKQFNAVVYVLDENDAPLKWTSYFTPENLNVEGEWEPKYANAGEGNGYSRTIGTFSVKIPDGCRAFVWVRADYQTIIDGVTVTDVQGSFREWGMNGGITVTVEG